MRTLKLILLFILIAGNIVLLFNLGSKQYGPEPAAMLSPAEKDKIFEEVIGKKIADEEFFETHLAKVIAQIYNEKHKQEPVLSPSCPDNGQGSQGTEDEGDGVSNTAPADEVVSGGLSRVAQQRDEVAQRDAEELAKEEARKKKEEARKKKEEAARKAMEEAARRKAPEDKANKEAAKEKVRAEILELVKKKDLAACKNHPGWRRYLSDRERWDVELVLKPGAKYSKNRAIRNAVIKYVNSKVFNGEEITWELLKQAREGINKIESNHKIGHGLMEGVR